jgi:hypothetical protein
MRRFSPRIRCVNQLGESSHEAPAPIGAKAAEAVNNEGAGYHRFGPFSIC